MEPTERGMSVCVPGQRLTLSNKYNGEQLRRRAHVLHIFSLIPVPYTRCNAHTCMQTHRRTHTLTQYKRHKMTYKLSRDFCCYLFLLLCSLCISRTSSLTEKDSKIVFFKGSELFAVMYTKSFKCFRTTRAKRSEDHRVRGQRAISQTEGCIVDGEVKDTCGFQHISVGQIPVLCP